MSMHSTIYRYRPFTVCKSFPYNLVNQNVYFYQSSQLSSQEKTRGCAAENLPRFPAVSNRPCMMIRTLSFFFFFCIGEKGRKIMSKNINKDQRPDPRKRWKGISFTILFSLEKPKKKL